MLLPIADGGEGSLELLPLRDLREHVVLDPLGRAVRGRTGLLGGAAFVESSEACGRQHGSSDPTASSSFGVGQLLQAALQRSDQVILALGGSATVDLGCGMAAALGTRWLDAAGRPCRPAPEDLHRVHRVEGLPALPGLRVWVDVDAPLLSDEGLDGRSFFPQKGVLEPERVLAAWRAVLAALERSGHCPSTDLAGGGASGGMGLMAALLGGRLESGGEAILDALGVDEALGRARLVITGEGSFDRQSLAGKGPGRVLARAHRLGIQTLVLAGRVEPDLASTSVRGCSDPSLPLEDQLRRGASSLRDGAAAWWRDLARPLL